jgi:hypothetical protein
MIGMDRMDLGKNWHVRDLISTHSQIRPFAPYTPKIPKVWHEAVSQIIEPNRPVMHSLDSMVSIGDAGHVIESVGIPVPELRMPLRCLTFCFGCSNWCGGTEYITVIVNLFFRMLERAAV